MGMILQRERDRPARIETDLQMSLPVDRLDRPELTIGDVSLPIGVEGGMPLHHVKELLGHANIKTTDTYLNATRIGLQESMRKFEEFRKTCTPVAQTSVQRDLTECDDEPLGDEEVLIPPSFVVGGVDGTRTRGLRRDRPAF